MANLRDVARSVEQRAAHKLARGVVTLRLPIYDGQYLGQFGVLAPERILEFEASIRAAKDREDLDRAAEFIADACRAIMARPDEETLRPVKLTHEDGTTVRFDKRFAEALGLEPAPDRGPLESMADVVLACWTVEDDEGARTLSSIALDLFGSRLLDWMQDTSRLVEGELVGESNGARP